MKVIGMTPELSKAYAEYLSDPTARQREENPRLPDGPLAQLRTRAMNYQQPAVYFFGPEAVMRAVRLCFAYEEM